ncbi:unnamed protein product [Camellia sinensis]
MASNQIFKELNHLHIFKELSNIRLLPRLCNCGRTAAIYIVRTNENGNQGGLFFVCPSKYSNTPTPHCNYFKFVDEDDEDVTSRIRSNTRACDAITVEDFNDVRTRLHDMENDYGRRLERIENNIKAMVYFIIFSIILYFIM